MLAIRYRGTVNCMSMIIYNVAESSLRLNRSRNISLVNHGVFVN